MYEKFKQLGKDSTLYGLGSLVGKIVGFLLIPIYTRIFSPSDYGIIEMIGVTCSIIGIILSLGLDSAMFMCYYRTDDQKERRLITSVNFFYQLSAIIVTCILIILFSSQISLFLFKNIVYSKYITVAFLGIPFVTLISFCTNILRLNFQPIKFIYITLGNLIISTCLSIYFVVIARIGIIGIYYAILISAVILSIISLYLIRQYISPVFSFKKFKELLKIGIPLAPVAAFIWIMDFSDRYFLTHFTNLHEIGLYSIANKLALALALVILAFRTANAPFQFSVQKDKEAKKIYAKTLTYYIIVTFFVATGLSIFAKEALIILAPPIYLAAYRVTGLLAFSIVIYGLYHLIGIGLILSDKRKYFTISIGIACILNLFFNNAFIPLWGIMGAALATLLSYSIGAILTYYYSQKYYFIGFEIKKILKVTLVTLILTFVGTLIIFPSLLLSIVFKILLMFCLSTFLYSLLEPKEIQKIKSILKNILYKYLPNNMR